MTSRPSLEGFAHGPYFYPVISIPIALLVAIIAKAADAAFDEALAPVFELSGANARTLFGGVAGAMITATAVIFWVRSALVQLAASQLSPRVLALYMHDRFQQASVGFLLGVFTYMVVVVLSLPRSPEADAPTLSTLLGAVLAVAGLLVIIIAISKAVLTTRISEVLATIADETRDRVVATFPEHSGNAPEPQEEVTEPPSRACVLTARTHGWIQSVDVDGLMAALPAGAQCWLDVRVGSHVTEDSHLGSFFLAADDEETRDQLASELQNSIRIQSTRSLERDLTLAIRELVDIGLAALAPGTKDTTAAFEVILQLGIVLREILLRDLPPTVVRAPEGRVIYRRAELSHDDYVNLCFQQLRLYGSQYPSVANGLLSTLGMLKGQLIRNGLEHRTAGLQRQGELVVAQFDRQNLLPADRDLVYRMAAWHGFRRSTTPPADALAEPSALEQIVGTKPAEDEAENPAG